MRERLEEPLTLSELARVAYLSPFHFNRVFRLVTGVPPGRFLAALRMSEAKRLLLESDMSVTDICISVGYSSLGTFTTLFGQQVGVGPREFRRLGTAYGDQAIAGMIQAQLCEPGVHRGRVTGQVCIPESGNLIMMGLFPRWQALGKPVACTSTEGPGYFQMIGVPDGTFCLLAAAHPADATVGEVLVGGGRPGQWVGATDHPVTVERGRVGCPVRITLRPTADTDPPILIGIPLLSIMPPLRASGSDQSGFFA
jgi:AraC family transcriptional regulator